MNLVRLITRIGFGLAAVAIVTTLGFTFEYQPVIEALAH